MSVKKDIYGDIKTALEAVTGMKHVLHYNGQENNNYEKEISHRFPQSWIQLTSIDWKESELTAHNENRTRQQKTNACSITIYTAQFSLKPDDDTFEDDLDLIDLVYRALTNLDGDNYTPLQRASEADVPTNNNVRVWAQTYTTMLTEYANVDTLTDAAPVELSIVKVIS